MKILLPVDGSDYTMRMLAYLGAHNELLSGGHEYVLFTAVAPIPLRAARFLDSSIVDDYYSDQAEQVLRPVREFAVQHGWKFRACHAHGHAAEAIAEMVNVEKPDLIVMGTHGQSSLGNMLLGSVVTGVLARCTIPVLLIR